MTDYTEIVSRLREWREVYYLLPEHEQLLGDAADAIEELLKDRDAAYLVGHQLADKLPVWIPVTERLPEPKFAREWFLVCLASGCIETLAFERDRNCWWETGSPVTHWMPLPAPPKEEV